MFWQFGHPESNDASGTSYSSDRSLLRLIYAFYQHNCRKEHSSDIMDNLLILGAGQYGMLVKEIAESLNCFDRIDFLDDNSEIAIGHINELAQFVTGHKKAAVAIGNAEIRLELLDMLEKAGYEITCLIHPKAYVAPTAVIGKGTKIKKGMHIGQNVRIFGNIDFNELSLTKVDSGETITKGVK